jgi:flagellin-like protein
MRSIKAISPILATLLLIVIAVAAIVVTYAWIMTYMSGLQKDIRLFPENIRWYGNPTETARNLTQFTVGNSGGTDTIILRLYLGNSKGNLIDVTDHTDIGSGKALGGQSATNVTLTWPNDVANAWEPGKTYYYKIVPSEGQYLETFDQASS